jgi:hypothetical protein
MEENYVFDPHDGGGGRDSHVISDLYQALDLQPRSVEIHERLLEMWQELGVEGNEIFIPSTYLGQDVNTGLTDMAFGIANTILEIEPTNKVAKVYLRGRNERRMGTTPSGQSQLSQEEWIKAESSLQEGYISLKLKAKILRTELEEVYRRNGTLEQEEDKISKLRLINDGDISGAISSARPISVREAARDIIHAPEKHMELLVQDLEAVVRWATLQVPPLDTDALRGRLVKRRTLLEAALPDSMQQSLSAAFTQIEREFLKKKYANSVTMVGGESIEEIPASNFFVSEDNYAWDMEELAAAIEANDGVMRNPLSKQMFSEDDIRMILAHRLGQRLRPLQMSQNQLRQGVRPRTIDKLDRLGKVMLDDQTQDSAPSRKAMDEFLAYVATLPQTEQDTINRLKIPGVDKFTGQPFDYSIGESVKDAKANTTCFHKVENYDLNSRVRSLTTIGWRLFVPSCSIFAQAVGS